MKINQDVREQARELRRQGFSVNEIMRELGVSKSSVSVWVRDIELTEAQKDALKERQRLWGNRQAGGQANRKYAMEKRIQAQNEGREKAKYGNRLHMMGCMLYWAEGAKDRNSIVFVNSDAQMMAFFMRFLREELNVPDDIVKMYIHCHTPDDTEHEKMKRYWLELLALPDKCFQKMLVKKGSEFRINKLEYGLCTIRVYNTELTMQIYGAIQEYAGFDNPDWLF